MIYAVLKYCLYAALVYVLLIALMYALQGKLQFMPDTHAYTQAQVGVSAYTEITVTTADNLKLHAWYAPAQPGRKTVVFFHGNASTWQWRAPDFVPLIKQGYGVLLAGYRGYGGNAGTPSESGFYGDAESYMAYLNAQNIPADQIVLYGESLGTGVAIEMAVRHKNVAGIILEAPYASIAETAAYHYPFVPFMKYLVKNRFDSIYKIGALQMPKLFFVAAEDKVVPPAFSKRLFEYTPQPKAIKVFTRAGHNDMRNMGAVNDTLAFLGALKN